MSESDQPLISECPSCQTRFRVTEEQLAVADGRVRCGACLSVFDGREAMVTKTAAADDDPIDVLLESDAAVTVMSPGQEVPARASQDTGEKSPEPTLRRPINSVAFVAAITVALAVLVVGVFVLQFEQYAHHPALREAYEIVGVDLPPYRALDAIRVTNQSVDERLGEDLVVRLDLANTAPRSQRFPTLAVRFHRAGGALLAEAEQSVEPRAYLPSPTHTRRMPPNKTTTVVLRIDDPGPDAMSYSISLL